MSRVNATTKRRRLRRKTYVWMMGTLAVVSALIYWEQTALLYALSTLAMCILLFIVAFSNIEDRGISVDQPTGTDAPGIPESKVTNDASSQDLAEARKIRNEGIRLDKA